MLNLPLCNNHNIFPLQTIKINNPINPIHKRIPKNSPKLTITLIPPFLIPIKTNPSLLISHISSHHYQIININKITPIIPNKPLIHYLIKKPHNTAVSLIHLIQQNHPTRHIPNPLYNTTHILIPNIPRITPNNLTHTTTITKLTHINPNNIIPIPTTKHLAQ